MARFIDPANMADSLRELAPGATPKQVTDMGHPAGPFKAPQMAAPIQGPAVPLPPQEIVYGQPPVPGTNAPSIGPVQRNTPSARFAKGGTGWSAYKNILKDMDPIQLGEVPITPEALKEVLANPQLTVKQLSEVMSGQRPSYQEALDMAAFQAGYGAPPPITFWTHARDMAAAFGHGVVSIFPQLWQTVYSTLYMASKKALGEENDVTSFLETGVTMAQEASAWLDKQIRVKDPKLYTEVAAAVGGFIPFIMAASTGNEAMAEQAIASATATITGESVTMASKAMATLTQSSRFATLATLAGIGGTINQEIAAGKSQEEAFRIGMRTALPTYALMTALGAIHYGTLPALARIASEAAVSGGVFSLQSNVGSWARGDITPFEALNPLRDKHQALVGSIVGAGLGIFRSITEPKKQKADLSERYKRVEFEMPEEREGDPEWTRIDTEVQHEDLGILRKQFEQLQEKIGKGEAQLEDVYRHNSIAQRLSEEIVRARFAAMPSKMLESMVRKLSHDVGKGDIPAERAEAVMGVALEELYRRGPLDESTRNAVLEHARRVYGDELPDDYEVPRELDLGRATVKVEPIGDKFYVTWRVRSTRDSGYEVYESPETALEGARKVAAALEEELKSAPAVAVEGSIANDAIERLAQRDIEAATKKHGKPNAENAVEWIGEASKDLVKSGEEPAPEQRAALDAILTHVEKNAGRDVLDEALADENIERLRVLTEGADREEAAPKPTEGQDVAAEAPSAHAQEPRAPGEVGAVPGGESSSSVEKDATTANTRPPLQGEVIRSTRAAHLVRFAILDKDGRAATWRRWVPKSQSYKVGPFDRQVEVSAWLSGKLVEELAAQGLRPASDEEFMEAAVTKTSRPHAGAEETPADVDGEGPLVVARRIQTGQIEYLKRGESGYEPVKIRKPRGGGVYTHVVVGDDGSIKFSSSEKLAKQKARLLNKKGGATYRVEKIGEAPEETPGEAPKNTGEVKRNVLDPQTINEALQRAHARAVEHLKLNLDAAAEDVKDTASGFVGLPDPRTAQILFSPLKHYIDFLGYAAKHLAGKKTVEQIENIIKGLKGEAKLPKLLQRVMNDPRANSPEARKIAYRHYMGELEAPEAIRSVMASAVRNAEGRTVFDDAADAVATTIRSIIQYKHGDAGKQAASRNRGGILTAAKPTKGGKGASWISKFYGVDSKGSLVRNRKNIPTRSMSSMSNNNAKLAEMTIPVDVTRGCIGCCNSCYARYLPANWDIFFNEPIPVRLSGEFDPNRMIRVAVRPDGTEVFRRAKDVPIRIGNSGEPSYNPWVYEDQTWEPVPEASDHVFTDRAEARTEVARVLAEHPDKYATLEVRALVDNLADVIKSKGRVNPRYRIMVRDPYDWSWLNENIRATGLDHPQAPVFVITKLLGLKNFDPGMVRNLQVSVDPGNPRHMARTLENVDTLLKKYGDRVNIKLRIRSVATASDDLNALQRIALDFARTRELEIIETRMRFKNEDDAVLQMILPEYYTDGAQRKHFSYALYEKGGEMMRPSERRAMVRTLSPLRSLVADWGPEAVERIRVCAETGDGCAVCKICKTMSLPSKGSIAARMPRSRTAKVGLRFIEETVHELANGGGDGPRVKSSDLYTSAMFDAHDPTSPFYEPGARGEPRELC